VDDEVNAVVKLLLGVQGELVKKIDDMGGWRMLWITHESGGR
jgi:hypothetical protein